jgi:signal transduction histidine kinase
MPQDRRASWTHLPRRTVRLRITLLYGALFLVTGAALLAVTYFLVRHAIGNPNDPLARIKGSVLGQQQPDPSGISCQVTPLRVTFSALDLQLNTIMRELLTNSGLALVIMTMLSVALGWLVAGRLLRPLRSMITSVREISATNLHRRLTLTGPADELRELGDTFDSLLDRLESAFQAQRQFVANASHELRTPLARQRTIGQVALSDPAHTVDSLRQAHERILVANDQQERMIEALLTLTRSQTGLDMREPVDLAELVESAVEARKAEATYRDVRLLTDIKPATIAGHRNLAERLITNLLDNALRYNTPAGWIRITTEENPTQSTLSITNAGPPVPPDEVETLFHPFHRLTPRRPANPEGLGLGLSIVQAVAKAHDATTKTTPNPEGGLTIEISFPTHRESP